MTLTQLRRRIDQLDVQLLQLLNKRTKLVIRVGLLKRRQGRRLFDPQRERAILRQVTLVNHGPLSAPAVRAIYREILRQIRRLEQRNFASARAPGKIS